MRVKETLLVINKLLVVKTQQRRQGGGMGGGWCPWVAQSVERLTSAQVMISQLMSSSPSSGSVLTARSLEPASDPGSPSLSAPDPLAFCLCLSQRQTTIKTNLKTQQRVRREG